MKKHILEIVVVLNTILVLALCGFMIYIRFYESGEEIIDEPQIISDNDVVKIDEPINQIAVEIKGAVAEPGVYYLPENAIVNELVEQAGGLNSNAYTKNINFSKKLQNEMVVYIYTNYEYSNLSKKEPETPICSCPDVDITPCLDTSASIIISESSSENNIELKESNNGLININTASISELTSLNGIGESKAKSIIEYRQNNGLFPTKEDIKNVTGISEATYEKIKDFITV